MAGRKRPGGRTSPSGAVFRGPAPRGPEERAQALLLRLETGGPNPGNAAEELDRLQARLARDGKLDALQERVTSLAAAWASRPLLGETVRAWLTLVGAFDLREHAARVAALARDSGLPAPLRVQACRVLPGLRLPGAPALLLELARAPGETAVRAAAAEALAECGDRELRPALESLLETDLPRPVWTAAAAALERLR